MCICIYRVSRFYTDSINLINECNYNSPISVKTLVIMIIIIQIINNKYISIMINNLLV